jgi:hypothetical protein
MADYQWNPLTDEKKFEDLVNDLCSEKYGLEFQIYGRKGQKQHGIDGSALTKDKKHILHQCKNKMITRSDKAIQAELLKDLANETEAMVQEFIENKEYKVDKFIFANSFKRDTKLQDKAIELSSLYSIMIIVWSWDEISDMLEEYKDIAKRYYPTNFQSDSSIKTINAKNNLENVINHGTMIFGRNDESLIIKKDLRRKYKEIKEFKKAIFTYYSIYGTNFDSFRRATTFDELFDILEKEDICLYCLLKELGREYNLLTQEVDCNELKAKIEANNKQEISGLILRVNWNKIEKNCSIDGYLRFSSESFEPLQNIYEEVIFNQETIKHIIQENLENRKLNRVIELQLILPNELYNKNINFQCENQKIKIVKRLLLRVENWNRLDIDAIRYWQRNSQFYRDHKIDIIEDDFIYILDENSYIDEFQELDDDRHICLLSNNCLNSSIREIYDYGVPFVFYSFSQKYNIIKTLDLLNKQVKNIKSTIFRFMKKYKETHFIYDDYYDVGFLKHESKVEGTEDDYI